MAKNPIKKSKLRLLLNAEAFCFGPSAAIASFFPYLRKHFDYIGYMGKNHTLDLQRNLPYEAIHDISGLAPAEERSRARCIAATYDIFFTALDFSAIQQVASRRLHVIVYDPLAWYWKRMRNLRRDGDLYIAQDFFGVKARLRKEYRRLPLVCVVPPIVPESMKRKQGTHVLINLGGLQNPFWSVKDAAGYARLTIESILQAMHAKERVIVTTSQAVAKKLADLPVRVLTQKKLLTALASAKYAFMTSGLGNIYDAARCNVPTIWLPPTNDSQGQQVELLKKYSLRGEAIDWQQILPGLRITYRQDQPAVLKRITQAVRLASRSQAAQQSLTDACAACVHRIEGKKYSACRALLDRFGTGGAKKVGDLLYAYAQKHA